ncbi:MAG: YqgE/AlgH family protein [Proteobacteria bacterium]|nr:YqgE/AlgH family protein [Pseudomonadota bacterium]
MNRFPTLLVIACCAISSSVIAAEEPGRGKLLVATKAVHGPLFEETVVLLLNYDATGAAGVVVNRPTEALPSQALPEYSGIDRYEGPLYWGGPVELFTLRALLLTDAPPDDAISIFDGVYLVPLEDTVLDRAESKANLRFFAGYAGWAPGQLDRELAFGSWHIVAATEAIVFADDPDGIWRSLLPSTVLRAATDKAESSALRRPLSAKTGRFISSK